MKLQMFFEPQNLLSKQKILIVPELNESSFIRYAACAVYIKIAFESTPRVRERGKDG